MKVVCLEVLLVLFLGLSNVFAGANISSGGDVCAIDFVATAKDMFRNLAKAKDLPFELDNLEAAIRSTKVSCTDRKLVVDDEEVTAENFPAEKKILVNRDRWRRSEFLTKKTLTLHEYLSILGISDKKYEISASLMMKFGQISHPKTIVAEPGSRLARYEDEVKFMNSLKDTSVVLEVATKILKKWFGFTEVKYDFYYLFGGQKDAASLAKFYASHLRSMLPFWASRQSFINLQKIEIGAVNRGEEKDYVFGPPINIKTGKPFPKNKYVLILDVDKHRFADLKTSGSVPEGYTFEITTGWGEGPFNAKYMVATILGYDSYYFADLDIN